MPLSPLNLSNLLEHGSAAQSLDDIEQRRMPNTADFVMAYRCSECGELHEDRHEAEFCCARLLPVVNGVTVSACCPLCASPFQTHREAVDCCLWKDFPAPTRWEIADAVEAGGEWNNEILKRST